jgi:hypothetical protein
MIQLETMQASVWKSAAGGLFVKPPPGSWSARDAALALAAIDELVDPGENYIFVADLSAMTGYEPAARRMWQEWFAKRNDQLLELWIVGPTIHPVVRLGLAAVSVFTRKSFRFAARVEDIAILRR